MAIAPARLAAGALSGGAAQSLAGAGGALLVVALGGDSFAAGLPAAIVVIGSAAAALAIGGMGAAARRRALGAGAAVGAFGGLLAASGGIALSVPLVLLAYLPLGAGAAAVSLSRYVAAEQAEDNRRGRAMAGLLVFVTVGAVLGPNRLAPMGNLASALRIPELVGPYLLVTLLLGVASLAFSRASFGLGAPAGRQRPA